MYVVSRTGALGRGREDHLRPRVHPRAPGPALLGLQGPAGRRRARPERPASSPARPSSRATRRSLMTHWALGQPDPDGARRASRTGSGPGADAGRPRRDAGRSSRDPALPVHDGLRSRPGGPGGGRLAGRRRVLRAHAGLDRADPAPREVRGRRGAGRRSTCPTTSPTDSGPAGRVAARGHVRRVPDWTSGSASAGVADADGRRRRGRLGRRPPRGHRGPGRRLGRWSCRPPGTRPPTRPSSRPRRAPPSARPAGPDRSSPGAGGNVRWVVVADDATTLGTVAGVLGLAG